MPNNNNQTTTKPKQLFSNELTDRLKNIGDVAFVVDKNDIAIRVYENDAPHTEDRFFYLKQNLYANTLLTNLRNQHKQELKDLLTSIVETILNPEEHTEEYQQLFPDDTKFNSIIDALDWFGFYEGEE